MIDHSLLRPDATREQLKRFCEEAVAFGFKAVCINVNQRGTFVQSVLDIGEAEE
jgi:deoxyribose-phosphate aldolase